MLSFQLRLQPVGNGRSAEPKNLASSQHEPRMPLSDARA
jgi:hypothetical protein